MMLYVILLPMVILPSALSVIELSIWIELALVIPIEPNLWNTVDWDRNWLVDFYARET